MTISRRRVRAVFGKEIREFRHNGNIVYAMGVLPLVFLVQPLIETFTIPNAAAVALHHEHTLVYLLAIPALVPAALASYSVVGERLQGTLEPILSTPIRKEELLLGKALAAFVPAVVIAYAVFAFYVAVVELFARAAIASALVQAPDVIAQLVFTPLLAAFSIWIGMAVSSRSADPRTSSQLAIVTSLPTVAVTSLVAFDVIPASLPVALAFGGALLVLDRIGWRLASALFDRERLITSTR